MLQPNYCIWIVKVCPPEDFRRQHPSARTAKICDQILFSSWNDTCPFFWLVQLFLSSTPTQLQYIYCWFLSLTEKLLLCCIKRHGAVYNSFSSLGGTSVSASAFVPKRATDVPVSPPRLQAAPCHHKLFSFVVELKLLSSLDSSSSYTLLQHSYRQYRHSEDVKGFLGAFIESAISPGITVRFLSSPACKQSIFIEVLWKRQNSDFSFISFFVKRCFCTV